MTTITDIRNIKDLQVICLGSHPGIIQSMLDYDFLIKRKRPSIMAIIANGRRQERYFWGQSEVIIPVVSSLEELNEHTRTVCQVVVNFQSARRVLKSMKQAFEQLPNMKFATIFAEQTPERHTFELLDIAKKYNILLVGPSSVGLLVPGKAKLGAIGGTRHAQLSEAGIVTAGDTAVISTSGGIVNELIHTVNTAGLGVSFALALGGDRYPLTTPAQAILLAQEDPHTKQVAYFGELGGNDEYDIATLLKEKKVTKDLIVHIAGTVAELFETPPQFGHAKAIAQNIDESASAKKQILKESGAIVCETFADIAHSLKGYSNPSYVPSQETIEERHRSLIVSHISGDYKSETQLLGDDLLTTIEQNSMASLIISMLLGTQVRSEKLISFIDYVMRLLVDHGPYVSGAVNTIVAARAGKDLVSSLSAGILTIGPRFGGAINAAAGNWLTGVYDKADPQIFTEFFARKGNSIPGIGHKKYRIDTPDPRVEAILAFASNSNDDRYLQFALSIAAITSAKKDNLILNVDGVIAAVMLDILESKLGYTHQELSELVDIDFFNAIFVLSRSVGFTAHYLDQRRHDEGLLRLANDDVRYINNT